VKEKLKVFIKYVKNQTGKGIKIFRSDNGSEFVNKEVRKIFEDEGICHKKSVPYNPEQNGKAEREMRTLVESARTMLLDKKLSKEFWAEAVNTAVYVINRTGKSSIKGKTPYELWFGKPFGNFELLRVFGSEVYAHVPSQKRQKWDAKCKKGMFVGYEDCSKGVRVYFMDKRTVEVVRDVVFIPEIQNNCKEEKDIKKTIKRAKVENEDEKDRVQETEGVTAGREEDVGLHYNLTEGVTAGREEEDDEGLHYNLRDRNKLKAPDNLKEYQCKMALISYKEAVTGQEKDKWIEAIEDEKSSLMKNETWKYVSPQDAKGKKILTSKWVFKVKEDGRYKAKVQPLE
jgi:hypothetical protein